MGTFYVKKSRQAPIGYGKPNGMVMLRENQLCLETWLDDLAVDGSGRRGGRPIRKRSSRVVSVELSRDDQMRLKEAARRMGVTPREFAEQAIEAGIVAMEELDD